METVIIEFDKRYSIYQPGMVAGFPKATAEQIVASGAAHVFKQPKESFVKKMVRKGKKD